MSSVTLSATLAGRAVELLREAAIVGLALRVRNRPCRLLASISEAIGRVSESSGKSMSANWLQIPEGVPAETVGLILVDHGSRREASNQTFETIVARFAALTGHPMVEAAHMELAEPSIAQAFARCVTRGATTVVCHPYFLLPGRHWNQDVPALMAEAALAHPGVRWLVTAPLGVHDALMQVVAERMSHCLKHAMGKADACDLCAGTDQCVMH